MNQTNLYKIRKRARQRADKHLAYMRENMPANSTDFFPNFWEELEKTLIESTLRTEIGIEKRKSSES